MELGLAAAGHCPALVGKLGRVGALKMFQTDFMPATACAVSHVKGKSGPSMPCLRRYSLVRARL